MIAIYETATGRVIKVCGGNEEIPDGCAEFEIEEGDLALAMSGCPLLIVEGALLEDLAPLRTTMKDKVDREAGEYRTNFITAVPGQEMTYLRKEAEARAFAADNQAAVPLLEAEATATSVTTSELAASVIAQADAWAFIGAAIEAARMGAKKAISDAVDRESILTAATVDWSSVV